MAIELDRRNRREVLVSAATLLGYAAAGICPFSVGASAKELQAPPPSGTDAEIEALAEEVVDTLEQAYGVHSGVRRNHAKGFGALGSFVGTKEGAALSRSALFGGERIEVVARFSLAGGDPKAHDGERSARGLALEFRLPGGALHHITMLHTPMFFARSADTFLAKFKALIPDPSTGHPDPAKFKAYTETHPDNAAQAAFLARNHPPPSYANCAFYGIHTFKFVDRGDKVTPVRFRFAPHDGEKQLTDAELEGAPNDFLQDAFFRRVEAGPVEWDMFVTIGQPGDTEDDPTILWPNDRAEVKAGTLSLTSATADAPAGSYRINFDPMVMADGIAATADPILLFRSPSYVISYTRRLRDL